MPKQIVTPGGDDERDEPPKHKNKIVQARVPDDVADKALKRATREGRTLTEVIRSWLFGWADDELPSPPRRGDDRAPQRPSKRRGKQDEE
jgi:hypothetical protein